MLRYEDRVFGLARRILGRNDEARDIAQDVFMALWENPRAYSPRALFSTWLYRVTTNRALNRLRWQNLRRLVPLSPEEPPNSETEPQHFGTAAPQHQSSDAPDDDLIHKEETAQLERALAAINPRQRAALHLRYREELPVAEVARALKVSVKSAESLIFRGKIALKERMRGK